MNLRMVWIGIVGAVTVALLVALSFAATMPKEFVIEESITVSATKERIFPYVARLIESEKITHGKLAVTEDFPNEHVRYDIYFAEWQDKHSGEIRLTSLPDGTKVTWVMCGTRTFKQKLYNVFFHIEKKIRLDLQSGLNKLKNIAERENES